MIPEASHRSADYGRTGDSGSSGLNSDDLGRGSRGTLKEDKTKGMVEWSVQNYYWKSRGEEQIIETSELKWKWPKEIHFQSF